MSKVGVIIQARTGSQRFPYKVTKQLGDSTVLGQCIKRCTKVDSRFDVILACPESDVRELSPIADYFGVDTFGGSELDVLDRYYQCAKKYELDYIVRITADCPFVDPDIIRMVVDVLRNNPQCDYVSNVGVRTWMKGLDVEAFTFDALSWSNDLARRNTYFTINDWHLEHVTPIMATGSELSQANIRCPLPGFQDLRLVIDYPTDLEFARKLWPLLSANFGWRDVLKAVEENPHIKNTREEMAA